MAIEDISAKTAHDTAFFGHPRGLSTLFFTEMWERFSYYGMRALLLLFMTAPLAGENPGLGFEVGKASSIYGIYQAMVYLVALPGGWIADKIMGQKRSVFAGGCTIAAGHFCMAFPSVPTFYLGLLLIVIGTGLLKPNVSAMVSELYPEGGARRDAGFSVFYSGINLGALLGTTLCGYFGENIGFHWGFSLAGIGMVLGLIQYKVGGRHLNDIGDLRLTDAPAIVQQRNSAFTKSTIGTAVALALFVYLTWSGILPMTIQQIAQALGYAIVIMSGLFFLYLFTAAGLTPVDKKRLWVVVWLYILSAVFWAGFEQAGSSMNLFARDLTNRTVAGFEMPTSWLQDVNPLMIILFAPVFGATWTWLARRNANPSAPAKFALALFLLAAGFFVLAWGSANASETSKVSMVWLIVTYFFHTAGELCLSPVGLSSMTKLAPAGRVGQMMGVWFIASALGSLLAGIFAGSLENLPPSALFSNLAIGIAVAGVLALLFSPMVSKLSPDAN